MSVINQMLKDLDKRNPESENHVRQMGKAAPTQSTSKIILITSIIVLLVCFIAFYIWQLNNENDALKAEKSANQLITKVQVGNQTTHQESTANTVNLKPTKSEDDLFKARSLASNIEPTSSLKETHEVAKAKVIKPILSPVLTAASDTQITPAKKGETIKASHTNAEKLQPNSPSSNNQINRVSPALKETANKMSVSRRQLSPDELAAQKISLAEKALAIKQISKAEKLLEEAVIIRPRDSQTRKKLAALWYGRKAYDNATNLLSQGIALDTKDHTLRELKARIHLAQGNKVAALNTLKPLVSLDNEQYQIMLANTAQQTGHNEIAARAYKQLITMQPEIGRWYLGLAVLYDKTSQFDLASTAYKSALTKNDLSVSSESFIKQRIEVIGQ